MLNTTMKPVNVDRESPSGGLTVSRITRSGVLLVKMTRRPYGRDRLLPRNPKPKPRYEKSEVAARAAWPHAAPTAFPPSRLPTGRPVSAHVVRADEQPRRRRQ